MKSALIFLLKSVTFSIVFIFCATILYITILLPLTAGQREKIDAAANRNDKLMDRSEALMDKFEAIKKLEESNAKRLEEIIGVWEKDAKPK